MRRTVEYLLVIGAGAAVVLGPLLPGVADPLWAAATLLGIVPAAAWVAIGLWRREAAVDLIALLALIGTLATDEYFAGAVISLMLGTGRVLESRARSRAHRDLSALLARAPRQAHVIGADGAQATVDLESVTPGTTIAVLPGEVVPLDGRVADGTAVLDESALTGEPLPVTRPPGAPVSSGVVNAGGVLTLRTTATAEESTYAGIVRMVRAAEATGARSVRIANRFALWFIPVTLALAGAAWWAADDVRRAVAVLVIATPCPLLLAVPIAIVAGLSRAARRGVVVKGGSALEALAGVRTMLLDKTGTVTVGEPTVEGVEAHGLDAATLLRLAASVELSSPHAIASSIVAEARERDLALTPAADVTEEPGLGLSGQVESHLVVVGQERWVRERAGVATAPDWVPRVRERVAHHSGAAAWVAVDSALVGAIVLADPIRTDAAATITALRSAGIERIALVSGDRAAPAERVGARLGVDSVIAECTPARKVEVVTATRRRSPCAMVGDGINDAPALAAASVGIALGARGATAASEAADVVITIDAFDRVVEAVRIARRSRRIALQSAALGMGLAAVGMGAAAVGWLPPAPGAIAQEAIDIVAIISALRALVPSPSA